MTDLAAMRKLAAGYLSAMAEGICDDSVFGTLTRADRKVWAERMDQSSSAILTLIEELSAIKVANEWQDISTAPKDRPIDLWCVSSCGKYTTRAVDCTRGEFGPAGPGWQDGSERCVALDDKTYTHATHWRDSPLPPSESKE